MTFVRLGTKVVFFLGCAKPAKVFFLLTPHLIYSNLYLKALQSSYTRPARVPAVLSACPRPAALPSSKCFWGDNISDKRIYLLKC